VTGLADGYQDHRHRWRVGLPSAWWQQLAVGGRLVVPLRLHGSGLTRSIAFDLGQPGRKVSTTAAVCCFMPMRGTTETSECHVRLADGSSAVSVGSLSRA
jgi:hypothetical protein